jgi:hypothetical protein
VVIVIVVIVPPVAVPVMIVVPVVVVLKTAAVAVPVAYKILAAFMAGRNPTRSHIGRPCPISPVPSVVPSDWIPIALDPHKIRSGT